MKRKLNLRERILKYGPEPLSDEELLAVILRTGTKHKNVLSLAKEIIETISPKSILDITPSDLKHIPGLGKTKIATILASIELVKRNIITKPKILSPEDAVKCCYELQSKRKENFVVLYLNSRKMLLGKEYITLGSADVSYIDPREVFIPALKYNSSGIIIIHNHPSGEPTPSQEDKEITKHILSAGELLNIELVDHIIISETGYFSFKHHRLI